jgi:hypothetical protein
LVRTASEQWSVHGVSAKGFTPLVHVPV